MESKELRIGNYVNVNNDLRSESGYYHEINQINQDSCNVSLLGIDYDYGQLYKFIEPIPLTEEWLLKFGYVKFKENSVYSSLSLVVDNVLSYTILLEHENNTVTMPNKYKKIILKHVHQLQNLYFALTNKELTTK